MEEPRIGVYVCWCGTNIAKMVDVEKVSSEIAKLPNVVLAKNYKYMCSDPGQDMIIQDIRNHNLNRVVVSACSPRIHELTFRKAIQNAGLNPYMFEMANIREQDSWVHENREKATQKALELVSAAVAKVRYHEALEKRFVDINPASLVMGAGIAGMSAALEIADAGYPVHLIEKSDSPGGLLNQIDLLYPDLSSAAQLIHDTILRVMNHPKIDVYLKTEINELHGFVGNFKARIASGETEKEIEFGNIVVATGLQLYNPTKDENYQYGTLSNVYTSLEFEHMLKSGKIETHEGKVPKHVAIIHCVGSRNEEHPYCSRTCCTTALKYANQIKSALPESSVYDLYADMRAFGKGAEELYRDSSKNNILFLNFDHKNGRPRVEKAPEKADYNLQIRFHEQLAGEDIVVPADMVILMVGATAHTNAKDVAHLVGISMCGNHFYIEKHPKLDPVATTTDGVYIVGNCHGPKEVSSAVDQARAAAARVMATIMQKEVEVEVTTAEVNENICCGCQTCISVCPYVAISYDDEKNVSNVNEVLCKGCGTCASACPTGAIKPKHFTDQQIWSLIEGLMQIEN